MPVYEYACTACGERLEARQGFDDPPLEECPRCAGKLRKLFSPVGIVFKGSGFYATDSRSGSGGSRSSETSSSKSDTKEASASSSGDSRGDTKGAGTKVSESKGRAEKSA